MNPHKETSEFWVYIAQCANGSYYVGTTQNIEKRIHRHSINSGSRHMRVCGDGMVLWHEEHPDLLSARSREAQLKRWTRRKKEALISGELELLKKL
ncbi:GIY-YIG nuclease family protein [Elusimicrobiota bacterium]